MRLLLVPSLLLLSLPALAQQPVQPQMPPPPPAVQAPPTAPTPVKPLTVKPPPTVKGTKAKSSNCRDATSGKFVTGAYAKKNPTTTVCEQSK